MKKLFDSFRRGHTPDSVALSAYLDRRLTPNETVSLDAHLEGCAACRQHLAGLGEARSLLRAMPQAETPRSFRLRQADVEAPARQAAPTTAPWLRALPAFGGVAAAVFVLAIALDVTGGGGRDEQMAASRTTAELAESSAPAGGIAGDSGGEAYDNRGPSVPMPAPPEDGGAADAATSAATAGDDTGLNADVDKSPSEVEAARDASRAGDDDGWPLARYVAILAGLAAVAAAGTWMGFTFKRRRN